MTYPSIKETVYHSRSRHHAVLVVPHGADAREFFRFFPEIPNDPELQKVWPLFQSYLEIERDGGASEISHAVAYCLASDFGIRSQVVELNYPRGLVDGGRLRDHCLRPCLPLRLMDSLKEAMLRVHETSLSYMDRLYEFMAAEDSSFLIDIHTMASFCPVGKAGTPYTLPVSFPQLEDYVNQYLDAYSHAYHRKIDLICADQTGRKLADPILLECITNKLRQADYACLENEPYHAAPIYLSYQHMLKVPSISIDVPKHLIAVGAVEDLELDRLQIDPVALRALAAALASGIAEAIHKKKPQL
ncbi:MAG: hypothetical protein H7318_10665 [Oligoflexus sp.]|nr:hypothetical protein [Oligoflexus sp.]